MLQQRKSRENPTFLQMSKPWGGCGITIGWLALQDLEMKQQLVDVQYFGTACPARASELQARKTTLLHCAILNLNAENDHFTKTGSGKP